jgi:predicted nucleic acid-binding protein
VLVVDANVAIAASFGSDGFAEFGDVPLVAPPLMWSEARSSLHELLWRGEISHAGAETTRVRLESCPVERRTHKRLGPEAWKIAEELGWAKTYDAEYLALARILECRVVTLDGRLRRGADRLGLVVAPHEL